MAESNPNQAEHEQISTALQVEKLEAHLFRSKSLWVPIRGRGVFGGQVISQGLVSATNCIDPAFGLHSLHCYFLSSASPATPIVYFVERLRQGRSYVTCSVKAVQKGSIVFMMMCSFQKPEPWQPSYQWQMPSVPSPEECVLEEDRYLSMAKEENLHPAIKKYFEEYAADRMRSPIAVKMAKEKEISKEGKLRSMYWMKARNITDYEAPFQKCMLSYMSDLYLLGTATRSIGMKRFSKAPDGVGMTSTIDHAIWFYSDTFDCGDWLLYEMDCSRGGSGRAVTHGRWYTVNGTLVAVTNQEGVVRANVRGPQTEQPKLNAKL